MKICVFSGEEFHEEIKQIGVEQFGNEEIIKQIAEGKLTFDKIIATPDQMTLLKQHARVLGPKGLMPNVKSGTLVKNDELLETIRQTKQGLVEFRVNEAAYIMNKIGKRSFDDKELHTNLDALLTAIARRRPDTLKGKLFGKIMVKTSMGPPLRLDAEKYQEMAKGGI